MNKKIKIVFLIGVIMLVLGILFYAISFNFTNNDDNEIEQKTDTNKTVKIQEERCLDNICIDSMVITVKDSNSYITGNIINKSDIDISESFIDLDFILEDGREVVHSYKHSLLKSKEKIPFTITIPIDYMTLATDYTIKESIQVQNGSEVE